MDIKEFLGRAQYHVAENFSRTLESDRAKIEAGILGGTLHTGENWDYVGDNSTVVVKRIPAQALAEEGSIDQVVAPLIAESAHRLQMTGVADLLLANHPNLKDLGLHTRKQEIVLPYHHVPDDDVSGQIGYLAVVTSNLPADLVPLPPNVLREVERSSRYQGHPILSTLNDAGLGDIGEEGLRYEVGRGIIWLIHEPGFQLDRLGKLVKSLEEIREESADAAYEGTTLLGWTLASMPGVNGASPEDSIELRRRLARENLGAKPYERSETEQQLLRDLGNTFGEVSVFADAYGSGNPSRLEHF